MIQSIIDGIIAALAARWGDKYPYYTETEEQELETPCFSIRCVAPKQQQKLGRRYLRQHLFSVTFIPPDVEQARAECYAVFEDLLSILEIIKVEGDDVRGTNLNGHIEDNVLVFTVNYDFFVHQVPVEKDTMGEMTVTERVEHDEENG